MKCTRPRYVNPWKDGRPHERILVDCGKCTACRANLTRMWTLRLRHEAELSESCIFITLTYDNEHLPPDGVSKRDVQDFISDLRRIAGSGIRYYICSEYGEDPESTNRPHYHGLLFNAPDYLWTEPCSGATSVEKRRGKSGAISYVSTRYNDIWRRGYVSVGQYHVRRVGYLAHYYVDKGDSPMGQNPNFALMSRRPGIGADYADAISDKLLSGSPLLAHTGRPISTPRYYRTRLARLTGECFDESLIPEMNAQKYITKDLGDTAEANLIKAMTWKHLKRQI